MTQITCLDELKTKNMDVLELIKIGDQIRKRSFYPHQDGDGTFSIRTKNLVLAKGCTSFARAEKIANLITGALQATYNLFLSETGSWNEIE